MGIRLIVTLFLLLSNCISAYSDPFASWSDSPSGDVFRLNLKSGVLDVFSMDGSKGQHRLIIDYDSNRVVGLSVGRVHQVNSATWVSFPGSGQVYEIDFKDSVVKQLDGTYQEGYNFDAYHFIRDGVLYSYGGYGFWMENNLLTRFSQGSREWFFESSAPYPVGIETNDLLRHLRWYDAMEDKLYVGHYRTLYSYSFKANEWKAEGRIHSDVRESKEIHFNRLSDTTALLQSTGKTWVLDWRNNRFFEVDPTIKQRMPMESTIDGLHLMYGDETDLIVVRGSDKIEAGFVVEMINPLSWDIMNEDRFFTPYIWYKAVFYTLVVLVLSAVSYAVCRRIGALKNSKSDWIQFLTPQDKLLFNALKIGDLNTEEVNRILELENVGWEVQRRKRSEAIKAINAFANKALGFDIIERYKSPKDKRQVIYRLNQKLK